MTDENAKDGHGEVEVSVGIEIAKGDSSGRTHKICEKRGVKATSAIAEQDGNGANVTYDNQIVLPIMVQIPGRQGNREPWSGKSAGKGECYGRTGWRPERARAVAAFNRGGMQNAESP